MKLGPGLEGGSEDRALAVGVLPPPIRGGHNTLNSGFQGPLFLYDMGHLDRFHLAPSMHSRSQEPHHPSKPYHGAWVFSSGLGSLVVGLGAGIGI